MCMGNIELVDMTRTRGCVRGGSRAWAIANWLLLTLSLFPFGGNQDFKYFLDTNGRELAQTHEFLVGFTLPVAYETLCHRCKCCAFCCFVAVLPAKRKIINE